MSLPPNDVNRQEDCLTSTNNVTLTQCSQRDSPSLAAASIGDEVLQIVEWGETPYVSPYAHPSVCLSCLGYWTWSLAGGPDAWLAGPEAWHVGTEAWLTVPEVCLASPNAWLAGPKAQQTGPEAWPAWPGGGQMDNQTDKQMNELTLRIYPHYTGHCPLSGALPIKGLSVIIEELQRVVLMILAILA